MAVVTCVYAPVTEPGLCGLSQNLSETSFAKEKKLIHEMMKFEDTGAPSLKWASLWRGLRSFYRIKQQGNLRHEGRC
jgi:hypothetical protein